MQSSLILSGTVVWQLEITTHVLGSSWETLAVRFCGGEKVMVILPA